MAGDGVGGLRVKTGVSGLDDILGGGLPANRLYLIQGNPGVGKTTLALQFLLEGARLGERGLYVTLSETREELDAVARAHGWDLGSIDIYEMSSETLSAQDDENTLYVPAEVELGERMRALLAQVDHIRPRRLIIDSCSELRLLANNPLRFRRQLLALKEGLVQRRCSILLLENIRIHGGDELLQSLVHGVIDLEQLSPLYGAERRRIRVIKMREVGFSGGYHDFIIRRGGLVVFPRLVAADHLHAFEREHVSSGVARLDGLLGGGIDRGTSTLIMGPAGSGKSILASRFALAMAERGEKSSVFCFDEGLGTFFLRGKLMGMDLMKHVGAGRLYVQQIDPAEMAPGQFTQIVRDAVEGGAKLVVIDSLNGYFQAMPEEQFLSLQLHELLSYLRLQGVITILVIAQHGLLDTMSSPIDLSYLADTVLLLRYFEANGRVRKAISALKKRSGPHEDSIRELSIGPQGIALGEPLQDFHGVFTGVPSLDLQGPE